MNVAEFVTDKLIKAGVTDTFGIPGGVILRLIEAMKGREPELMPHLNFHEQMAGFAACGYAQASGKLGVAYATRGPGITNMITSIAEAYQESLPVLFVTAHASIDNKNIRFENNQELDIVKMVSYITKFSARVENLEEVPLFLDQAIYMAMSERKGPVLLDFSSKLWTKEVYKRVEVQPYGNKDEESIGVKSLLRTISSEILKSKRPIILIGDGIRHCGSREELCEIANNLKIPVLSSRGAQDILSQSKYYYGYVGSHGCRYSNFIISKCDLIIAIGNRLAFPLKSESFAPIFKQAKIIRLDIDEREFLRNIPDSDDYVVDAKNVIFQLVSKKIVIEEKYDWVRTCNELRKFLDREDCANPVIVLSDYMIKDKTSKTYVTDVGNNEFWVSRAFENTHPKAALLMSKSFGTLGVAMGRAIGCFYATKEPVTCIMGDQGFQYNLQELQYISKWELPIKIVILNNHISGMIKDHEDRTMHGSLIHVSADTGYDVPNIERIANAYNIKYVNNIEDAVARSNKPIICEIEVGVGISLTPNLPKGNKCQDMEPLLDRIVWEQLDAM